MSIGIREKKAEAIARMRLLSMSREAIERFEKFDKVSISEQPSGIFRPTDHADVFRIRQFEKEFDALVYAVVRTATTIGYLDSYLYVSKYQHEWEKDRLDLVSPDNGLFAYVYNRDNPDFSEIGSIGLRKEPNGGLLRIW